MQERKRPVFLVATANQVHSLPPELLRKGRFDEIFAIDLPNSEERKAIFSIHINKKKRNLKKFDLEILASCTPGFTGSEIESLIDEAMFNAFDQGKDITTECIKDAATNTVPLSVTSSEQIKAIREWASTRARFASKAEKFSEKSETKTGRKIS